MPLKYGYTLTCASGPRDDDFCAIGYRYEEAIGLHPPENMESWVIVAQGQQAHLPFGSQTWFTWVWYSPSGAAYVTDESGFIHSTPRVSTLRNEDWTMEELGPAMTGVWGLDDENVFAWGTKGSAGPVMYRRVRGKWVEIAHPGVLVQGMDGPRPDLLYAVGERGTIARWNGNDWDKVPAPTDERLVAIHVVGEDEMYAVGNSGSLLQGGAHGWGKILQHTGPLYGVKKFAGDVWVSAGDDGLGRRVGKKNEIEIVKPNIPARQLDFRGEQLLISCPGKICSTADGKAFRRYCDDLMPTVLAKKDPLWFQ